MTTFARQAEVMKTTRELALEGLLYFLRVHESKAKDYPDFIVARVAALETLQKLAAMEAAFGTERVRTWLDEASAKAAARLEEEGTAP